jgi:hypothetical protein
MALWDTSVLTGALLGSKIILPNICLTPSTKYRRGRGNMNYKRIFILLLILPLLLLSIPGCASSQEEGNIQTEPQGEGSTQPPKEIFPAPSSNIPSEPSAPIKVELYMPSAPRLNEAIEVTCTVSAVIDMPDSSARIELPDGVSLISGNLTWEGDLKANHPVSFSAEISFNKAGKLAISASARHMISEKSGWGDADFVYLNIGADKSEFGWPPTGPVKIIQTEPGDVEPSKSSPAEPPVESLPEPPSAPPPK